MLGGQAKYASIDDLPPSIVAQACLFPDVVQGYKTILERKLERELILHLWNESQAHEHGPLTTQYELGIVDDREKSDEDFRGNNSTSRSPWRSPQMDSLSACNRDAWKTSRLVAQKWCCQGIRPQRPRTNADQPCSHLVVSGPNFHPGPNSQSLLIEANIARARKLCIMLSSSRLESRALQIELQFWPKAKNESLTNPLQHAARSVQCC